MFTTFSVSKDKSRLREYRTRMRGAARIRIYVQPMSPLGTSQGSGGACMGYGVRFSKLLHLCQTIIRLVQLKFSFRQFNLKLILYSSFSNLLYKLHLWWFQILFTQVCCSEQVYTQHIVSMVSILSFKVVCFYVDCYY